MSIMVFGLLGCVLLMFLSYCSPKKESDILVDNNKSLFGVLFKRQVCLSIVYLLYAVIVKISIVTTMVEVENDLHKSRVEVQSYECDREIYSQEECDSQIGEIKLFLESDEMALYVKKLEYINNQNPLALRAKDFHFTSDMLAYYIKASENIYNNHNVYDEDELNSLRVEHKGLIDNIFFYFDKNLDFLEVSKQVLFIILLVVCILYVIALVRIKTSGLSHVYTYPYFKQSVMDLKFWLIYVLLIL